MKRRRRVEVRIERHELSIFAGPLVGSGANPDGNPGTGLAPLKQDQSGLRHIKPERCPICGSTEMLLLADAIALDSSSVALLKEDLEEGRSHLHCSTSGDWWVCGQSHGPG
jgi:hypothetical protein